MELSGVEPESDLASNYFLRAQFLLPSGSPSPETGCGDWAPVLRLSSSPPRFEESSSDADHPKFDAGGSVGDELPSGRCSAKSAESRIVGKSLDLGEISIGEHRCVVIVGA